MFRNIVIVVCAYLSFPFAAGAVQFVSEPIEGYDDFHWGGIDQTVFIDSNIRIPEKEQFTDFDGDNEFDGFFFSEPFDDWNSDGFWSCCLSESYSDTSGNGSWDPGEPFWDDWNDNNRYDGGEYAEPLTDWIPNGVCDYSFGEPYDDINANGVYDELLVLSIAPGTIVKSRSPNSNPLRVYGSLDIMPAPAEPVVFTSWRDTEYGVDTGDGVAPSINDWGGLHLRGHGGVIENCLFRYGGNRGYEPQGYSYALLGITEGSMTIRDCEFEYAHANGIYAYAAATIDVSDCVFNGGARGVDVQNGGSASVSMNQFLGCDVGVRSGTGSCEIFSNNFENCPLGIYTSSASHPILNNVFDGGVDGIHFDGTSVSVEGNDFQVTGYPFILVNTSFPVISGNTIGTEAKRAVKVLSGNIASSGIWGDVQGENWPYFVTISGYCTIAEGVTLTLPPGTIIKSRSTNSNPLRVYGSLDILPAPAEPVVFTSWRDTEYGVDTGDGCSVQYIMSPFFQVK